MIAESSVVESGAVIDGYRIGRCIGTGGVGTVFAAVELASGRHVALKVLRSAPEDPQAAARFEREASAANAAGHPGIVPVLAIGKLADGRPYLALPLLSGRTLREELALRGSLPPAEAWEIARQVADALAAAHACGVVHRDVKPENVFLEDQPGGPRRALVLDFGLAKRTDAALSQLTQTGAPLGTPAYMAPEQWWSAPVDGRTDQYALGITLFEMICGRPPFEASSFAELLQKHLHEPAPTLAAATTSGISARVETLIARLLQKEKDARFASMDDLASEGDLAFDRSVSVLDARPRKAPSLLSFVSVGASAAAGIGLVWGVGYAGDLRRDVGGWFVAGGLPMQILAAALFGLAILRLARGAKEAGAPAHRSLYWLALAPAFVGLATTYVGWSIVEAKARLTPPLDRLDLVHEGMFEANLGRFVGVALASIALTAFAIRRAPSEDRRTAGAAALGFGALVALSLVLSAPSATLVAVAALAPWAVAFVAPPSRAAIGKQIALERGAASLLAAGLAAAVGLARIDAREAAAWAARATRAERASEILSAATERRTSTLLIVATLVVVVVAEGLRLRRAVSAMRWSGHVALLAFAIVLAALIDLRVHLRFRDARDAIRAELAPQFALFAQLDPPSAEGIDAKRFPPHPAAAVQIARSMVAVDGVPVAPIAALSSAQGEAHVGDEIDRALATAATRGQTSTRISITVDRQVPFGIVRRLLARARASGAQSADVLLTRGDSPELPEAAPMEAALVKAGDFVAIPVDLADEGAHFPDDAPFGRVAPALAADAPLRLAIPPPVR